MSQKTDILLFGAAVKMLRKSKGLSQRDLSGIAGVALAIVSKIEAHNHPPTLRVIRAFAAALQVDPLTMFLFARPEALHQHDYHDEDRFSLDVRPTHEQPGITALRGNRRLREAQRITQADLEQLASIPFPAAVTLNQDDCVELLLELRRIAGMGPEEQRQQTGRARRKERRAQSL